MLTNKNAFAALTVCTLIAFSTLAAPNIAQGDEIKDFEKKLNIDALEQTADDAFKNFAAESEKGKNLARDLAEQTVLEVKLQKAIKSKWGDAAERKFASICNADTVQDDDEAEEIIDGDIAVLNYKNPSLTPLYFVKSGGKWKLDADQFAKRSGERLAEDQKGIRRVTAIIETASKDFAAGNGGDAVEFLMALKKKVDAAQQATP